MLHQQSYLNRGHCNFLIFTCYKEDVHPISITFKHTENTTKLFTQVPLMQTFF